VLLGSIRGAGLVVTDLRRTLDRLGGARLRGHPAQARPPSPRDLVFPPVAVKEVKAATCVLSTQASVKLKERYNGLNRGLWGSTPGLLNSLQPDRRRTYRESIAGIHQHQGALCPDGVGGIFGDGAVLRDTQGIAYLWDMGDGGTLVAGTPPALDAAPTMGAYMHTTANLSQGWTLFWFRRSIPAGCGELRFRIAGLPSFESPTEVYDLTQRLLVSIDVVPVAGGSSIVTRLFCGPYASPLDSGEVDFGYVEVEPEENVAYRSNVDLKQINRAGWNRGAEITPAEQTALQLNSILYRVSQEIRVQLTYPPARSSETYHATGDYMIKVRFQMRNDAGDCDPKARLQWLCCYNAPGY